jgi:recombination associated protein RdgC
MAFHLRSLTARRYRAEADLPPVNGEGFRKRLAERAFRPLSAHEERSVGWVTADNCLDADFARAALVRGSCAAFALRIDRRRVPTRLLRARVDLEMRARRAAARDAGGEAQKSARREERNEVRRVAAEALLAETSPTTEVHPVLWWPRERSVWFLSLSKRANEAFRELFAQTFDASVSSLTPYHRAVELLQGRGASEALAEVRRTEFGRVARAESGADDPVRRAGTLPLGALESLRALEEDLP